MIKSKNTLGIEMTLSESDLKIIEKYKSDIPELKSLKIKQKQVDQEFEISILYNSKVYLMLLLTCNLIYQVFSIIKPYH